MGRKRRAVAKDVRKVKKTICLDVQTARRLASFAGLEGLNESEVVTAALTYHMRGFKSFRVDVPDVQAEGRPVRLALGEGESHGEGAGEGRLAG